MHHDQGYYCVNGKDNVALIPLDKINKDSMELIKGFINGTKHFFQQNLWALIMNRDKEFEKIPNIENNRDKYEIISYECDIGDAIAFNYATIHSAYGNNSETEEEPFIKINRDDARYIKRQGEMLHRSLK